MQLADSSIKPIIEYLEEDKLPENIGEAKRLVVLSQSFELVDGVLYHIWYADGLNEKGRLCLQLVAPKTLVFDILSSVHGDQAAGHFGMKKTFQTLKLNFYWKGMLRDVKDWVQSCYHCNASKRPTRPFRAPLTPIPPRRVGQCWAMDILGPLKQTHSGSKYILVFMEYATKWSECFPLEETKAYIIARYFVEQIAYRFGSPRYLQSDLGANLIAKVVNEAALLMGTRRILTSPYRPQTNSLVERFNYSLIKQLSAFTDANARDWDQFIRPVVFSYNTSVCVESTHYSPFYLMFGRDPRSPFSTTIPETPEVPNSDNKAFIENLITGLTHAHEIAQENMKYHKEKMKEQYDKRVRTEDYHIGQKVWVYFPAVKVGQIKKLHKKYSGPYIIMEKVRPKNYKVVRGHDLKPLKNMVHVDRLKPFIDRQVVPPTGEELLDILGEDDTIDDVSDLWEEDVPESEEDVSENTMDTPEIQGNDLEQCHMENQTQQGGLQDEENQVNQQPCEQTDSEELILTDNDKSKTETPEIQPRETEETYKLTETDQDKQTSPTTTLRRSTRNIKTRIPEITLLEDEDDSDSDQSEDEEYEINKIIKGRYTKNGGIEYLVDWKGFPKEARSYEPFENLNDTAKRYIEENNVPIMGRPPSQPLS